MKYRQNLISDLSTIDLSFGWLSQNRPRPVGGPNDLLAVIAGGPHSKLNRFGTENTRKLRYESAQIKRQIENVNENNDLCKMRSSVDE